MKGRVALVTGGTRGIGKAIAIDLHKAGAKVAVNYAGNDEAAKKFHEETGIPTYKFDVSDYAACEAAIRQLEKDLDGHVEILVNNAGITRDSAMHKMSHDKWDDVIQTNLTSCFNMSQLVIENMRNNADTFVSSQFQKHHLTYLSHSLMI